MRPALISGWSGFPIGDLVENIEFSLRQIEVDAFPFPLTYFTEHPLPLVYQLQFVKVLGPIFWLVQFFPLLKL